MMIFNHFSFLHQFNTCNFGKEIKWKEEPKDKKGKTSPSCVKTKFLLPRTLGAVVTLQV